MERDYTNRIVDFFLEHSGNSYNVKNVYSKLEGSSINRVWIKEICLGRVDRGYFESIEPKDRRSGVEFKITPKGIIHQKNVRKLLDKNLKKIKSLEKELDEAIE